MPQSTAAVHIPSRRRSLQLVLRSYRLACLDNPVGAPGQPPCGGGGSCHARARLGEGRFGLNRPRVSQLLPHGSLPGWNEIGLRCTAWQRRTMEGLSSEAREADSYPGCVGQARGARAPDSRVGSKYLTQDAVLSAMCLYRCESLSCRLCGRDGALLRGALWGVAGVCAGPGSRAVHTGSNGDGSTWIPRRLGDTGWDVVAGPGDSITNMFVGALIAGGLTFSTWNIWCLMGHGKKIEGYFHLPPPLELGPLPLPRVVGCRCVCEGRRWVPALRGAKGQVVEKEKLLEH